MSTQLVGSNVVVVARQFNPSVMSQIWLVKNGVVGEDEFEPGSIFSEAVVQFHTAHYSILLVPQQLQFQPKVDNDREQELIEQKVGAITAKLPHTPYTAVGLNFFWHVTPDLETVHELTRDLFYREDQALFRHFDATDAKFGAYLSKDILDCRLKLDIRPVSATFEGSNRGLLVFNFNYHLDLQGVENAVGSIEFMLKKWDKAKGEAARIVKTVVERSEQ